MDRIERILFMGFAKRVHTILNTLMLSNRCRLCRCPYFLASYYPSLCPHTSKVFRCQDHSVSHPQV